MLSGLWLGPDLVEYDIERIEVNGSILVPCPSTQFSLPDLSQPGASIELSAICAEPEEEITVTGTGFAAGDKALIFFVPYKADVSEEVQLPLADAPVPVDAQGNFSAAVALRKDRTSENPQKVRVVVNRPLGMPKPSQAVYDTFDKIVETLFLALIATTLGVFIAVPFSFLAARNLMINVTSAFGSLVTIIALAPVGWFLGSWLFSTIGGWGANLISAGEVPGEAALWIPALLLLSVQAMAGRGEGAGNMTRVRSYGLGILGALAVALVWGIVAGIGKTLGLGLSVILGPFSFLGNFLFVVSDALVILLPVAGGFAGLLTAVSLAGGLFEGLARRSGSSPVSKGFVTLMAFGAGAVIIALPAALLTWLYEFPDPMRSIGLPALIGGLLLAVVALVVKIDYPIATGLIIYYFTRTIFNVQRAIEPLILAIVFVVWVGIGPFAGVLALTLHTVAALGKLYSEQVENIAQGPIEAVTATGANRLQTIVLRRYAPDCASIHCLHNLSLGHKRAHVNDHWFCRRRGDRLLASTESEFAKISTGCRSDDSYRHCGCFFRLY